MSAAREAMTPPPLEDRGRRLELDGLVPPGLRLTGLQTDLKQAALPVGGEANVFTRLVLELP